MLKRHSKKVFYSKIYQIPLIVVLHLLNETLSRIHINYTFFYTGTVCLDLREETCYTEFRRGSCAKPLEGTYKRNICCCSSVGKAWGETRPFGNSRCEACPRPGTADHAELCPKVADYLAIEFEPFHPLRFASPSFLFHYYYY